MVLLHRAQQFFRAPHTIEQFHGAFKLSVLSREEADPAFGASMHQLNLPDWAIERGRAMNYFPRIEPSRTALIALDLQNAFMEQGQIFGNRHAREIVPNVNRLARTLRSAGGQVIWSRQTVSHVAPFACPAWQLDTGNPIVQAAIEALTEGNPGHRLHQDVAVEDADIVLNKYRYSAFIRHSSDIEETLSTHDIDTLIIAGTLTNVCCESSARDAYMLGYRVLFASDATAAVTDAEHNAALLNLALNFADVRSTEDLVALIAA